VEAAALVEPTGDVDRNWRTAGGAVRFRGEVVQERPAPGLRLGARAEFTVTFLRESVRHHHARVHGS
jgi:hypothetical protein